MLHEPLKTQTKNGPGFLKNHTTPNIRPNILFS